MQPYGLLVEADELHLVGARGEHGLHAGQHVGAAADDHHVQCLSRMSGGAHVRSAPAYLQEAGQSGRRHLTAMNFRTISAIASAPRLNGRR